MDLDDQLQRAAERGKARQDARAAQARARELTEEEWKRLHSQLRLDVSDHIERSMRSFETHFPGFRHETLYGDRGWGAACSRDDLRMAPAGRRQNEFSRLETPVRPYSEYHILDIQAKGTIRNRELFQRRHHESIDAADATRFRERIDGWIVEFAELFSSS